MTALLAMLKRETTFEGTATELLESLSDGQDTRAKGWPKTPKVLSGLLTRLAPNLRAAGIKIDHITAGTGNAKRHVWRMKSSVATTTKSTTQRRKLEHQKTLDRLRASIENRSVSKQTGQN